MRDRAGEVVFDVDRPITVLRSLPAAPDVRALARFAGSAGPEGRPWTSGLPLVRLRARGVTLVSISRGRSRPGLVVAVGALLAVAVTASLVLAGVRAAADVLTRRR
ncbi:MAG: hypothetical protein ACFCUP_11575 [Actinomycetales bacterium]